MKPGPTVLSPRDLLLLDPFFLLSICISYHLKSSRLKTSRVALVFAVEVGGRTREWFGGPQPRHFPPEQPLTPGAINH